MIPHKLPRILVSTDAVGGIWTYALELADVLRRHFAIEFAVLGPGPSPEQMQAAKAAEVRVHVTDLPLDWTADSPDVLASASEALAALARRLNVCLVQLHTPALLGAASWPVPVLAVLHSCVGTWWQAMRGSSPVPEDFFWRMAAVQSGLQKADAVIAPTLAMREAAWERYGTRRPIQIVYNTRRAGGLPSMEGSGILAAGRLWDEAKNIALLDRAAGLMRNVPIRAAGPTSGPNGAGIVLKSILGLGSLTPDALRAEMSKTRIFAAPALYEPFGLAVLEAAQAGRALVLADIPTFRELWDGAACFLPADNSEVWARLLSVLHRSPDECRAWGIRARVRAQRYGTQEFAKTMLEIYLPLLGAPACAPAA
jgi:glycosyltransferase involved in cell wall biosynthesis